MKTSSIILIVLFVLALLFVSPILTIWALNTIFPTLAIPLNVWTWLAVAWMHVVIAGSSYKKD
jgi:hypothetical protein